MKRFEQDGDRDNPMKEVSDGDWVKWEDAKVNVERLEWLEEWHSLHWQVEFLYVVDGYQCTLTHDGNPIHGPYHAKTLVQALDLCREAHPQRPRR